jgi:hypothetical protein
LNLSQFVSRVHVDPRKLVDYALNPEAPWGRHKAAVFARTLGFTQQNYADLLAQIERQALHAEAILHSQDEFGRRYTVDLTVLGANGREGVVRTGWLIPPDAAEARLITLYVRR